MKGHMQVQCSYQHWDKGLGHRCTASAQKLYWLHTTSGQTAVSCSWFLFLADQNDVDSNPCTSAILIYDKTRQHFTVRGVKAYLTALIVRTRPVMRGSVVSGSVMGSGGSGGAV